MTKEAFFYWKKFGILFLSFLNFDSDCLKRCFLKVLNEKLQSIEHEYKWKKLLNITDKSFESSLKILNVDTDDGRNNISLYRILETNPIVQSRIKSKNFK